MNPAYSVIVFTTASGAGYGLLAWLAFWDLLGSSEGLDDVFAAGLVIALVLISGGLLSSTFHLGRPERAWRALSQWRTSWLSREGILALATYPPAGVLLLEWALDVDLGVWAFWTPLLVSSQRLARCGAPA